MKVKIITVVTERAYDRGFDTNGRLIQNPHGTSRIIVAGQALTKDQINALAVKGCRTDIRVEESQIREFLRKPAPILLAQVEEIEIEVEEKAKAEPGIDTSAVTEEQIKAWDGVPHARVVELCKEHGINSFGKSGVELKKLLILKGVTVPTE